MLRVQKKILEIKFIYQKKANETKYWIRMLAQNNPELKERIRVFWKEAHEFHLIFQKITNTLDSSKKKFEN